MADDYHKRLARVRALTPGKLISRRPVVRILEVINKTVPYFEKQGIASPRLTIELLLAISAEEAVGALFEFRRELDVATPVEILYTSS